MRICMCACLHVHDIVSSLEIVFIGTWKLMEVWMWKRKHEKSIMAKSPMELISSHFCPDMLSSSDLVAVLHAARVPLSADDLQNKPYLVQLCTTHVTPKPQRPRFRISGGEGSARQISGRAVSTRAECSSTNAVISSNKRLHGDTTATSPPGPAAKVACKPVPLKRNLLQSPSAGKSAAPGVDQNHQTPSPGSLPAVARRANNSVLSQTSLNSAAEPTAPVEKRKHAAVEACDDGSLTSPAKRHLIRPSFAGVSRDQPATTDRVAMPSPRSAASWRGDHVNMSSCSSMAEGQDAVSAGKKSRKLISWP